MSALRLLILFLGMGSLIDFTVAAQPQAASDPLPSGPLLKRAPDSAQWLVYSYLKGAAEAGADPKQKPAFDERTLVKKTGTIRCEITDGALGHNYTKWCSGNLQAQVYPGVKDPVISVSSGNSGASASDFPGFDWISPKNYIGIRKALGMDCLAFQQGGGRLAYVSVETRLPVMLQQSEFTYVYQFQTPPAAIQVPPSEVQEAFKVLLERSQRAARKPAAP